MTVSLWVVCAVVAGVGGLVGAVLAAARKRHYLVNAVLAAYVTVAMIGVMPGTWIGEGMFALSVLGGVFVSVLLVEPSLFWAVDEWPDYRIPWRYMIFAVSALGMLVSIALPYVFAAGIAVPYGDFVSQIFGGDLVRFLWMVTPAVLAMVLRRV